MTKLEYTKPPKTYQEQIELLISRGLIIKDTKRAERHLSAISYYRLSAYMLPYKQWDENGFTDKYKLGTTWNQVHDLYVFDRKFRILIFDAIERLEIAIRTQIIYQLSHKYGSHWQDNKDLFKANKYILRDGVEVTIDVFKDIQKHIK